MAEWGVPRERMRILPDTVDGEIFRMIRHRRGRNGPCLLTVGRLNTGDRLKGVDLVLDALRAVSVQHPGVRYLIAGEGDDRPRLEARAREIGVANQAEFLGFVPDEGLPRLFNDADLFVMPSQKEGFGIVFLEALACGLPVIAGSRDGSSDPLLDGRIGLLVDPQHSSQVVESICSFLDGTANGYLRDPVGLRQEVLSHYGYDRFRRRVRDVIMEAWETAQT
ncbi:MAG: hypothetical protein A2X67_05060 [Ignavibacteria bacterium GWA2_55_11]|nr:MAG: hypothetical protein A2X67_05060 [Ignavibacteria bacterium GWA2_55_11]